MNSSRFIEGATLMSIGVFCASALVSFAVQSTHASHAEVGAAAMVKLPTVTVSAKRLNAVEKARMLKDTQAAAANPMMEEFANGDAGIVHAG